MVVVMLWSYDCRVGTAATVTAFGESDVPRKVVMAWLRDTKVARKAISTETVAGVSFRRGWDSTSMVVRKERFGKVLHVHGAPDDSVVCMFSFVVLDSVTSY